MLNGFLLTEKVRQIKSYVEEYKADLKVAEVSKEYKAKGNF